MKRKMIFPALALAACVFCSGVQAAQYLPHLNGKEPLYAGVQELHQGQINQALNIWIEKANSGDPKACAMLGDFYSEGKYVTPDYAKAINYLNMAIAADNADAQFRMGWLFYHGLGVQQDFTKSFAFFNRASKHGQMFAMEYLAKSYMGGQGTQPDLAQVVTLLMTIANPDWIRQSQPDSGVEEPVTHALSALSYLYTQQSDVLPRSLTVAYALALVSESIKPDPRTEQLLETIKTMITPEQEFNAQQAQLRLKTPDQFYKALEDYSMKQE